ncbi:Rv3235 family protein [Microbacterium sp. A93]|uniref:Rv3235 family protein n=1 Tax=Microbacterium sp. A93 TaxID=3450716 RepID=UPI003F41F0CF
MTTLTTAATPSQERPLNLTRSPVPASLPPLAGPGTAGAAQRQPTDRSGTAWAPRLHPDHNHQAGDRARQELRREEERTVRALARIVALACVEAELGLRPARQLSRWLDLPTYGKMVRRSELAQRIRLAGPGHAVTAPTALGARVCPAGDGVYEASATIQMPDRAKAMALRLEQHRGRWKVTALELG